jgi:hypothetical protein
MTEYLPLVSAIIGVFIGATVSLYVARLQFRLNVISKFRQEWIADMRNLLADYHSLVWTVCFSELSKAPDVDKRQGTDSLIALIRCTNKIGLMLHLRDPHQERLNAMLINMRLLLENLNVAADGDKIASLQNDINGLAGTIFELEQEKARGGK